LINISYLNFEKRFEAKKSKNILFPYLIGLAFGFGWTPCIGPILGSILALASIEETLSKAIILLTFYSVGLAIPFVLSGYLIQRFLVFSKNFKKNINLISKIGGTILLITGILILTNQLQTIGFYIIKIFPFMQNFG
jgi:cytochrome c-type biogenesis protein